MSFNYFDLSPVAGRIGAEISGIALNENLSDSIVSKIRKALGL